MPPRPRPRWLPLRTERLLLREFREDDLADIHAYGADPEVSRYMIWGPNTPEQTRAFLDRMLADQQTWPRTGVCMAVELAGEGRLIGASGLRVIDAKSRSGEIGYTLGRAYWGRGLALEAGRAMLACGFEVVGLRRIIATCDVRNRRSWRVMEKLGMRREACFRSERRIKGRWRDTYLYALLAQEWS